METHEKKVENYMRSHKEISQREAFLMGVYRLSAVIFEMKRKVDKDGRHIYHIVTEYRMVRNRDGSQSRVAYYSLGGE